MKIQEKETEEQGHNNCGIRSNELKPYKVRRNRTVIEIL